MDDMSRLSLLSGGGGGQGDWDGSDGVGELALPQDFGCRTGKIPVGFRTKLLVE